MEPVGRDDPQVFYREYRFFTMRGTMFFRKFIYVGKLLACKSSLMYWDK